MSILTALRLSREPGAGLALVGVLWGGIAASMPDIKLAVGASDAQLGFALLMSAAGGLLAMAVAPRLGRAMGRWVLPVLGLAAAAGLWFPLAAWDVATLGAAMFGLGISVAALDILTNVEISARESRHGLHLMNVNHALFSLAFAASAYATGLARQGGAGPGGILPWLSGICVVLALAMLSGRGGGPVGDDADTGTAKARPPWVAIGLTGVILFAGFVGENATEAWSALHIERTLGAPPGFGSFGPATLGLVMGIGRLSGQMVAERLGHARLIAASAVTGILGALCIAAAPTPGWAIAGVGVSALGMAVIVPSVNSMLGALVTGVQRAHALSRAWMLGIVGFFVGPAMMGAIAEGFGLRMAFAAVAVLVALILPAVRLLQRLGR